MSHEDEIGCVRQLHTEAGGVVTSEDAVAGRAFELPFLDVGGLGPMVSARRGRVGCAERTPDGRLSLRATRESRRRRNDIRQARDEAWNAAAETADPDLQPSLAELLYSEEARDVAKGRAEGAPAPPLGFQEAPGWNQSPRGPKAHFAEITSEANEVHGNPKNHARITRTL